MCDAKGLSTKSKVNQAQASSGSSVRRKDLLRSAGVQLDKRGGCCAPSVDEAEATSSGSHSGRWRPVRFHDVHVRRHMSFRRLVQRQTKAHCNLSCRRHWISARARVIRGHEEGKKDLRHLASPINRAGAKPMSS